MSGYFDSPWPAEDGGPRRLQVPRDARVLGGAGRLALACTSRRALMTTMTVLGAPGEVFLLTHSAIRSNLGLPTTACVERIDPVTLAPLARSPRLAGGPMWPGGLAVHRDGDLYVVYGRHAHRLDRGCAPRASFELPLALPYNSFVVLDNGLIVTKNLSDTVNARLTVLEPGTLSRACADVECPEPSIARLSADGDTVYVVGVRSVMRYRWDAARARLEADAGWRTDYLGDCGRSYGWDAVVDGRDAWFMDNGRHRYRHTMVGAGANRESNRLIRVSLADARDAGAIDVCGLAGGAITNPPLVDTRREVVVGYDSANREMRAWLIDRATRALAPLWSKSAFGCASHMILYPDSGEMVVNDWRRFGEEVVVLDVETGDERARVRTGGVFQGVVFPSVGWSRDLYWCSMGRVARVWAA